MLGVLPQDEDKVPADDDNQNPPFDFFGLGQVGLSLHHPERDEDIDNLLNNNAPG
jgi:hypothetical protein